MSDQLYANGRLAVMSNKLMGTDKFTRLADCNTVAEALKVLSEVGYAGGMTVSNPNDYEEILIAELDSAILLLREFCYDKNAVSYFLCKYNYHNAKVLLKRKYMRIDGVENCFAQTDVSPEKLQSCFVNDDYSLCSRNMAEACDLVDTQFAEGNRSPQVVDRALDKAMFADMRNYAKRSSIALVRKLYNWEVDTTNLMLLFRLKKAAFGKDSLSDWFVEGGTVKKDTLLKLWDDESAVEQLDDQLKKFHSLCTLHNPNLVAAELAQKAYRNKLVAEQVDFATIQPVVQYFYNKVDEIDKVRFVLISIKGGLDKEKIKERIK